MTTAAEGKTDLTALLTDYKRYDEYVDIVSCFEFIFTDPRVAALPSTVKYFDRYPRCTIVEDSQSRTVTPDFVVVFNDNSVLIGEIGSIAQHDNSVDKLCNQLSTYEAITTVSCGNGQTVTPRSIDIAWLVPIDLANAGCTRVLQHRMLNPDHAYKPQRPPSIIGCARSTERYTFLRMPHADNGQIEAGTEPARIAIYLDQSLKIEPSKFVHIKTTRGFMNDSASALYLATYLHLRFWPLMFGAGTSEARTTTQDVAQELQRKYGYGSRSKEVKRALELLEKAGLARTDKNTGWVVKRTVLGHKADRDAHEQIVDLIRSAGERPRRTRRIVLQHPDQGSLF